MKQRDYFESYFDIYSGILANNQEFDGASEADIKYEFNAPEFAVLKKKYNIEDIAGKGSDFQKAKRLCAYLAPRLTHKGNFNKQIGCDSLSLLEYSFENKEHGINCLNKAKILAECLLSLGIYARRVGMYPYSPFDCDNHVVTEFFDSKLKKWIMIDPSQNCYFIDEDNNPLSVLEFREKVSNGEFATIITTGQSGKNPLRVFERNLWVNQYFAKNSFYYSVDEVNGFGGSGNHLYFYPKNFDIKNRWILYFNYLIKNAEKFDFTKSDTEKQKDSIERVKSKVFINNSISILRNPPN